MSDSNYPSDWDTRRKEVYKRDGHECQNCGRSGGPTGNVDLHAHHIVPISNGGTHSKTNLKTMCRECHNAIHGDVQAPTASGSLESSEDMKHYTDIISMLSDMVPFLQKVGELHLTACSEKVDIDVVITHYEERSKKVRNEVYRWKRNISSFDTYDNPDSEEVSEEFKRLFDQYLDITTSFCQQILELDRLLQKYGDELTSVTCSECGKVHDESISFCGDCGNELPVLSKCTECDQQRSNIEQDFCQGCGAELDEYPQTQVEKIHDLVSKFESEKNVLVDDIFDEINSTADEIIPLAEEEL